MSADEFCMKCGIDACIIEDQANGYSVCTGCGLVLGRLHVDDKVIEKKDENNSSHVSDADAFKRGTFIDTPFMSPYIRKVMSRGIKKPPRRVNPKKGSETISTLAERLGLLSVTENRANEIYKKASHKKLQKDNLNTLLAACLFAACQEEGGASKTLSEISSNVGGISASEILSLQKEFKEFGIGIPSIEKPPTSFGSHPNTEHQELEDDK